MGDGDGDATGGGDGDGGGDSDGGGDGDGDGDGACQAPGQSGAGFDPGDDPTQPIPGPKPVAAADERPLPIVEWMTAHVPDRFDDPVLAAIHGNEFELPPEGEAYGVTWTPTGLGGQGELPLPSGDYIYAAANIDLPEGTRVFARADSVGGVFTNNGNEQPGDVYHLGSFRIPLNVHAGSNLIVVQGTRGRYGPESEVELFQTTNELVLNTREAETPQYPDGDSSVQYVGLPVLNVTDHTALDVNARVVENEYFEETVITYPGLVGGGTTHLALELRPKGPLPGGRTIPVQVRVEPPWFEASYETTIQIETVPATSRYRRTRRSKIDGSVQHYAVVPPTSYDPGREYGLIVSLHGHNHPAEGNASWHAARDWAYIIAPTNRHRGVFNWETFGRLDGLEAADHAQSTFSIDPERIHLTGHSMGGHGTWHAGTLWPDRFGMIAPCAAWISYSTYHPSPLPDGVMGRAAAASDTLAFIENLRDKPIYMVHGTADSSVPIYQSRQMWDALVGVTDQVWFHEEEGGDHTWDDPSTPGRDTVALPDMYAKLEMSRREVMALDFSFVSGAPSINPTRSYVTIQSQLDVMTNSTVRSSATGDTVTLETENVRSMELDGAALEALGVSRVVVDGQALEVAGQPIWVGPADGKNRDVGGPLLQVFERPWCFVYEGGGDHEYREVAAFLSSMWSERGRGLTCTIPRSRLDDSIRADYNLIYLGIPSRQICEFPDTMDVEFGPDQTAIGGQSFEDAAIALVFPGGDGRLSGAWSAVRGSEHLLLNFRPFSSRTELPDYSLWDAEGRHLVGFFSPDWELDPALAEFVY